MRAIILIVLFLGLVSIINRLDAIIALMEASNIAN